MKKLRFWGAPARIGSQALDVIDNNKQLLSVAVLSCAHSTEKLSEQIKKYKPEAAVVAEEKDAVILRKKHPGCEILVGDEGLCEAVRGDCDIVLNSLMGIRGMVPTYEAIKAGKEVALANKETLVAGGKVIMEAASEHETMLTPVDSEHSAIFQCLQGQKKDAVSRLILTGSGGPFRCFSPEDLEHVKVEQALRHPNWSMGQKITIDSATLMNKGLEVIEAMWLFGFDINDIDVVIHPQSIIHSMIEMRDGAVLAQMGTPDMRIPIAYALTYPGRENSNARKLDLVKDAGTMTFEKPDMDKFPCLAIAIEAAKRGGTYPAAMNGANEELVDRFLKRRIRFMDIPRTLERIMDDHKVQNDLSIEVILEADRQARRKVAEIVD